MAYNWGSKPVTNGLVFVVDAANHKSFDSGSAPNDAVNMIDTSVTGSLKVGTSYANGTWEFDGTDDYIDLGNVAELTPGTGEFTWEFWINPDDWSATYSLIFSTPTTNGIWIGKNTSNFVLRAAYVADDLQYSTFPTVGEWTHLVIARVGTTATMYYNTTSVASGTVTRNYVQGTSELARDGVSGNVFTGKISSAKYYNRGLSAAEVKTNFEQSRKRFGV